MFTAARRNCVIVARRIYKAAKGKHTQPPVSLHGQLLWREFFYLNGHGVANFGRMVVRALSRTISPQGGVNSISFGSPHVRP